MARLVEDAEIYSYLDLDSADDPTGNLLVIRDGVEDLLVHDCGGREFGPAGLVEDEAYDGTGGKIIFTRRPILSLDDIKFRYLPESVQETYFTLDITDYITWTVGKTRIYSHAYNFPRGYDNVLISYHYPADQPKMARQAVFEAAAMLYRARGSEDARSEQMGTFQHVMKRKLDELLFWRPAVDGLTMPVMG